MKLYRPGNPGNPGLVVSLVGIATFFYANHQAQAALLAQNAEETQKWKTVENVGIAALVGGLAYGAYKGGTKFFTTG